MGIRMNPFKIYENRGKRVHAIPAAPPVIGLKAAPIPTPIPTLIWSLKNPDISGLPMHALRTMNIPTLNIELTMYPGILGNDNIMMLRYVPASPEVSHKVCVISPIFSPHPSGNSMQFPKFPITESVPAHIPVSIAP